jgi:hypothetical protein
LYAQVQSDYKADCSYSANLQWDRASNHVRGTATVDNHLWFAACRKNLVVTFVDDEGVSFQSTVAIETAAATTDPTAPHRIDQPIDIGRAVPRHDVPFIDNMSVDLVPRDR